MGGVQIRHREGQVEFPLTQVIGLGPVPEPGELQGERGHAVTQIDQPEGAVPGLLLPDGDQAQGVFVEGEAPLQVQHIEIEMIKGKHVRCLLWQI